MIALVLSTAVAGACADRRDTPPAPKKQLKMAAEKPPPAPPPVVDTQKVAPPTIELLEPGAEPRTALRFQPREGARDLDITMRSSAAMRAGPTELPPMRSPPIHMVVQAATSTDPALAGTLQMTTKSAELLEDAATTPAAVAPAEHALEPLRKLHAVLQIGPNGLPLQTTFRFDADSTGDASAQLEQIRQALVQSFAVFPDEEIGKGARWVLSTTVEHLGAGIEQRTEFTLLEANGDEVELGVEIRQKPASQQPQTNEALKIRLDSLETTGRGTMTVRLDRLGPVRAKLSSESKLVQTVERDGQRQQVDAELALEVEVLEVAAGAEN